MLGCKIKCVLKLPFKLKGSLRYDEVFLFGILWVGDCPQE
jgi:hypothetical protein